MHRFVFSTTTTTTSTTCNSKLRVCSANERMHQRTNACSTAAAVPKLQKRVRESLLQKVCGREQEREARERERKKIAKNAFDSSKDASANCIARALALQPTLSASSSSSSTFERCQPPSQFFSQLQFFANIRLEADHKKKSTPELLFSLYSCFFLSFYLFYLSINYLSFYVSISQGSLSIPAFIGIFLCFYLSSLSI